MARSEKRSYRYAPGSTVVDELLVALLGVLDAGSILIIQIK